MRENRRANKISLKKKNRFSKAKKDFEKMQKEIAPFVRHRKLIQYSTAGKWNEVSSYIP